MWELVRDVRYRKWCGKKFDIGLGLELLRDTTSTRSAMEKVSSDALRLWLELQLIHRFYYRTDCSSLFIPMTFRKFSVPSLPGTSCRPPEEHLYRTNCKWARPLVVIPGYLRGLHIPSIHTLEARRVGSRSKSFVKASTAMLPLEYVPSHCLITILRSWLTCSSFIFRVKVPSWNHKSRQKKEGTNNVTGPA